MVSNVIIYNGCIIYLSRDLEKRRWGPRLFHTERMTIIITIIIICSKDRLAQSGLQ